MLRKYHFFNNFDEVDGFLVVEKFLRRFDVLEAKGALLESNAGLETRRETGVGRVLILLSDNCFVGLFTDGLLVARLPIPETARRTNDVLDKDERRSDIFVAVDEFNRLDDPELVLATFVIIPPILARRTSDADFVTVRSVCKKRENTIEIFLLKMYKNRLNY